MSGWRSFFAGWRLRTATPTFAVGDTLTAYVTGYDAKQAHAVIRIGDTLLNVAGLGEQNVDETVTVRVTQFDPETCQGRAELAD